jgi:hypothetical protein
VSFSVCLFLCVSLCLYASLCVFLCLPVFSLSLSVCQLSLCHSLSDFRVPLFVCLLSLCLCLSYCFLFVSLSFSVYLCLCMSHSVCLCCFLCMSLSLCLSDCFFFVTIYLISECLCLSAFFCLSLFLRLSVCVCLYLSLLLSLCLSVFVCFLCVFLSVCLLFLCHYPGNTKGGKYQCTIDLLLHWFGLICFAKNVSCHTADSKPVKQEVNGTVILSPLVFPALSICFVSALNADLSSVAYHDELPCPIKRPTI